MTVGDRAQLARLALVGLLTCLSCTALAQAPGAAGSPAPPTAAVPPPVHEPERCLLGATCIVPTLTILSLPNLFGIGVRVRVGDYLGLSLDYQFLPGIRISGIKFGTRFLAGTARVYPFAGKLFIGAGFGYQRYDVSVNDEINWSAAIGYPLVLINVGMMGRSGFLFMFDGGVLIGLTTPRTAVQTSRGSNQDVSDYQITALRNQTRYALKEALDKIPPIGLQLNLRLGYVF